MRRKLVRVLSLFVFLWAAPGLAEEVTVEFYDVSGNLLDHHDVVAYSDVTPAVKFRAGEPVVLPIEIGQ